jgi:NTE family protein
MGAPRRNISVVLSGGVALGAYQAGAYAALHGHGGMEPDRLAASSIGAVNAALIAGNTPQNRMARLQAFWHEARLDVLPALPERIAAPWRHTYSWLSVLHTRLFGRSGHFTPRLPQLMLWNGASVYDLAPLKRQLERFVDFGLLNSGKPRVSVVTTDIETGEEVVFDTRAGSTIGPDHLLASCGFLPDFPPVEIGGRLLGDGGLIANAPVETALRDEDGSADVLCFIVDLFSSSGSRPQTLEQAAARRWDLLFGNQTRQALGRLARERRFRPAGPRVKVFHLAYRAPAHEAGPEKPFDYSAAALAERWDAGYRDMQEALGLASAKGPGSGSVAIWEW